MKVKIPIGYEDIRMFEELQEDRMSFTWTFESDCGKPIDIVFIKDEEEENE